MSITKSCSVKSAQVFVIESIKSTNQLEATPHTFWPTALKNMSYLVCSLGPSPAVDVLREGSSNTTWS